MTIELNAQEADVLAGLLDVATKAGGLQVAGNALHFLNKLKAAVETEKSKTMPNAAAAE